MTIAFVHPHKSFLPEIEIYRNFFSAHGIITKDFNPGKDDLLDADIAWHFMGIDWKKKKKLITIHEYSSASTPPFSKLKDAIKFRVNCKPDYRLFNNEYVMRQFRFNDNVPFGMRKYGIQVENVPALTEPLYDFVYVGSTDNTRRLKPLFNCFTNGLLREHSLLVISANYEQLANRLKQFSNIFFKGPVPHGEIYSYVKQAKYGINFIPDTLPYNHQISAKFLDYLACKIPVVTTDYNWSRNFQKEFGGNYYFLNADLSNFTWNAIVDYDYSFPDLSAWKWEDQIRKSGVLKFIQSRFPEFSF